MGEVRHKRCGRKVAIGAREVQTIDRGELLFLKDRIAESGRINDRQCKCYLHNHRSKFRTDTVLAVGYTRS